MSSSFDNKVYDIIAEGSGGGSFTAGNGIDITSGTISVKVDNATIKTNSSGQLYSPTAKSITLPRAMNFLNSEIFFFI